MSGYTDLFSNMSIICHLNQNRKKYSLHDMPHVRTQIKVVRGQSAEEDIWT